MSIADNLSILNKSISKAAQACGRDKDDIQLIAVSKQQGNEKIEQALAAGLRVFGENRVQEAAERWKQRKASMSDLRLHLIGPLQTNKAAEAVSLFDCIETVDRPKLAVSLGQEMKKQNRFVPCLIQVNTGEEEQKSGVLPKDLEELLHVCADNGVRVQGLMCIPPIDEPAGLHFAFLKTLSMRYGLSILSMGMSNDYEQAIMAGATHIRLGSILFGNRE